MDNQTVLQPGSEPMVKTMPGIVDTAQFKLSEPAVQETISPVVPTNSAQAPEKKRKFKLNRLALLIIVLVIVLGASGWFYVAYGQAWWLNQGADLPTWENYQENATLNLKVHDVFDEKGAVTNQDWLGLGTDFSLEGAGLGIVYNNHQSGDQASGQVKLTLSAKDINFNFNTVFKKINKDVYVKPELNELSIPLLQSPLSLGEEWITFSTDQLDQWVNEMSAGEANKSVEEYLADSQQKEEELVNRIVEQKIFIYKDAHQNKSTASGNIKKFEYSVVPAKLNDLIKILDELGYDNKMTDDEKSFLNKFFEVAKISVWINTKTKFIQEVNIEALNLTFKDESGSRQFDIVLNYDISEAAVVAVTKPEPVINWLDFSNKIVSQFMSPENYLLPESEFDLSLDSDNDGLPDDLEALYGTDPNNTDTDSDGYTDGEEIENGYNPLGSGQLDALKM